MANSCPEHVVSDHAPNEDDFDRYRAGIRPALESGQWSEAAERASREALQALRERRQRDLGASWWGAGFTTAKTALCAAAPLLLAEHLTRAGMVWAAPPLLIVAGMACYGAVAIVHDLAHGSFVPSRRANVLLGHLLAPLVLLEFASFRRSHLAHHRTAQSVADPKRFGASHTSEANAPDYRTLDHIPWLIGKLVQLGSSVRDFPVRVRQGLYLCISPIFFGPAVLLGSGEFSLLHRDLRRPRSWLALGQSGLLLWLLGQHSPLLLGFTLTALVLGFAFVFWVFTTHLSPNQVYWTDARRATATDALNVSDVRCGALLHALGNGFSDHHSTHHLSAAIPCYRLSAADALVAPTLAPFRAPVVDLTNAASCVFLYDNFFRAIVLTNAESWDYAERGALRAVRRHRERD